MPLDETNAPEPHEQQSLEDESPEEFAEDIENDPAHNPEDEDLKRIKGG